MVNKRAAGFVGVGRWLGAAALAIASVAHGSGTGPVPIEALALESAVILEGSVQEVTSAWNGAHTQIVTDVTIAVAVYHKGEVVRPGADGRFRLRHLGGTVGDITMLVVGQVAFAPGERVFLFLSPRWEVGEFPVVAGEHGKFEISVDPATGREMLRAPGVSVEKREAIGVSRRASELPEENGQNGAAR